MTEDQKQRNRWYISDRVRKMYEQMGKPLPKVPEFEENGLKWLCQEAHEIDKWPDFRFVTEDGRLFGLFWNRDEYSILNRLRSASVDVYTNTEPVEKLAGFIMELGTKEPPFMFRKTEELIDAWLDHHRMYGLVPCEPEEYEFLLDLNGGLNIEDALLPPELRE